MHVLDSSAIIELMKGTGRGEAIKSFVGDEPLCTTALSSFETLVGSERTQGFLSTMHIIPFDHHSAEIAAGLERQLYTEGKPLSPVDAMIAGTCIAHNATLITCDNDFKRAKGLKAKVF